MSRQGGLDGLRALCLLAVLLFHSDFGWAQGGYLGVTAFFVLSGFLITGLLVLERHKTGALSLPGFWARRARRLAPGVLVLFLLVIAYLKFGATKMPAGVAGDGFASAFWFANWRFTFAHRSYAALFSGASPFEHMWSLSVEEQVYLVLPLIVYFALGRRGAHGRRGLLAAIFGVLVVASTATNILLHHPGQQPLHEYYGTDARAAEPLVGALLALLLFGRNEVRRLGQGAIAALDAAALVAAGGLVLMVARLNQQSDTLYRGGFLLAAVLSAVLVAAATQPGMVAGALRARPLQAVGRISYGGYLFHWPIFLWMTHQRTGMEGWGLFAARVAATLALATVSYKLVEQPIRQGRIRWPEVAPAWSLATILGLATLVVVAHVAPVGSNGGASEVATGSDFHPTSTTVLPTMAAPTTATTAAPAPVAVRGSSTTARTSPSTAGAASLVGSSSTPARTTPPTTAANHANALYGPITPPAPPPPTTNPNALRVAVVGDSMADGLAYGLEKWASGRSDVVVYDLAIPGCPLSRGGNRRMPDGSSWSVATECGWWADPSSDRSQVLAQFRPNVIVLQDGMNELPDRKLPSWVTYEHTGEPTFDQWLLSEYQAALKVFTGNNSYHSKVLALNAVCANWDLLGGPFTGYDNGSGDNRVTTLDTDSAELAVTGSQNVNYDSYLCPNGQFTQTVAGVQNGRPDGYHLSKAASLAVAEQWLGPMILSQGATAGTTPATSTPTTTAPVAGG
ncbi:MAG TPA: acyltransferase family protein [Acidimicrobiales bacterium]|nr:acyltransferase family protein [Acidimicrobiales bacterium]